jgi:hypothetical protein
VIEEIGRAVAQKVTFSTHTTYRAAAAPKAARAVFREADLTPRGIYQTAADMDLKPGEVMAVWEMSADEHRPIREAVQDLPPRPSKLVMKSADGKLMELNPAYIDINNRPPDYKPFTAEERAAYGV